jgi:uncharacterized protein
MRRDDSGWRRRISGMKIAIAALVLFAAAAIAGVAQPHFAHSADTPNKTITVAGNGTVETVPDRATFFFTVTTNADSAKAALAKNNDSAAAVAVALKGAKTQTSNLSINPRFDDSGIAILGYTASQTVSADADLSKIGGLIDAAVAAGANGVSGPSFSASDREKLYRDALKDALADAKAKAQALAEASGLTLGPIKAVAEGQASYPQPMFAAADKASSIDPGTQTIDATVTVTYTAG